MVSGLVSQLVAIQDREQAALARVRELKLMVSVQQARLSELERVVDIERQTRQQTEELSIAWQLQIEANVVECFRRCLEYQIKLADHNARAFITCFKKVT